MCSYNCMHAAHLGKFFRFTLNALVFASTATATGPTVATAASRSLSLPYAMLTAPVAEAPEFLLLYWHEDCCIYNKGRPTLTLCLCVYIHRRLSYFSPKAVCTFGVDASVINYVLDSCVCVSSTATMVTVWYYGYIKEESI